MSEHRKLATIMAVDVVGYSRAAETDEEKAAATVRQLRAAIDAAIAPHNGRVFNSAGDGFMIELPTASAGVEAARQLLAAPGAPPARIGLHLGEVMVADNGDLLGHGVNVAARLQQMAEPGSALVSQAVQAQIHSSQVKLSPLGKVQLDKMTERIDVFALAVNPQKLSFRRVFWRRARRVVAAALVLGVVGVGGYFGWRAFVAPAAASAPRLAVLRFDTVGETEPYFAETLADELIAYASRMDGLDVIARASSFSLEGQRATPRAAAADLAATMVLTGSVRRIGDRVRVNAQLVEAPSGRQLWTREFERPMSEVYLLQREIAARVAMAAGLRIHAPVSRRVDPQAYEWYVRGREAVGSDYEGAAALFEQALARDQNFASAWAYLAQARFQIAIRRWANAPANVAMEVSWLQPALDAADRAAALDANDPLPFAVRSRAYFILGPATEAAEERGGGAISSYAALGYFRRGTALARRIAERDPLTSGPHFALGLMCLRSRDISCAIDALRRHRELAPDIAPYELALALHRAGRSNEALALTREQEEAWLDFFEVSGAPIDFRLFRAMLGEGQAPSSAALLATLDHGGHVDNLIDVFTALDRPEDAARMLPRWGAASRPSLAALYDYRLAPMRARPEFWDLMEREGIAPLWRGSGQWPDFCETERSVCEQHLRV